MTILPTPTKRQLTVQMIELPDTDTHEQRFEVPLRHLKELEAQIGARPRDVMLQKAYIILSREPQLSAISFSYDTGIEITVRVREIPADSIYNSPI